MNQSLNICPRCGAPISRVSEVNPSRCEHCGADLKSGKAQTAPNTSSDSLLPSEYARLQRPRPGTSLEAHRGVFAFGLTWTIFSAIFLIIGIGLFVNESLTYNSLRREGIPITATVTALKTVDNENYLVHYKFRAPVNGGLTSFEDVDSVSYELYSTFKVEQPVEILYVISDPSISVIKAEFGPPATMLPLGFTGMGGLFVLIGAVILYGAVRGKYYSRLLRSEGRTARAYLFDQWQDKDSDGDPIYFVAYAFKTSNGLLVSHAEQNKRLYQTYQIGDTLDIRYLSDNPSICHERRGTGR